jgi:hypothetical protein
MNQTQLNNTLTQEKSAMDFEELRSFLQETTQGRVFDSLICVELGLEEYSAAWDAHSDMAEEDGEDGEHAAVVSFLANVAEYIGVDSDFEKALVEAPGA